MARTTAALAATFVACLLSAGAPQAQAAPISALYAFGDSLSDIGNVAALTGGTFPASPPYAPGRFSNGPIWLDDLAAALALPLKPSLHGGTDFAFGTALTSGSPISLRGQADTYLAFLGGNSADPQALYVVFGGGNNLRDALLDPANAAGDVQAAVQDIGGIVGDLLVHGARRLLVPNMPDLGHTPEVAAFGPAASGFASLLTAAFNTGLELTLDTLDGLFPTADIDRLDVFALFNAAIASPALFGFSDVTDACYAGPVGMNDGTLPCGDPDQRLFWDGIHPTARGHQAIADAALAAIPEPGTLASFPLSLLAIAALRRRARPRIEPAAARGFFLISSIACGLALGLLAVQAQYRAAAAIALALGAGHLLAAALYQSPSIRGRLFTARRGRQRGASLILAAGLCLTAPARAAIITAGDVVGVSPIGAIQGDLTTGFINIGPNLALQPSTSGSLAVDGGSVLTGTASGMNFGQILGGTGTGLVTGAGSQIVINNDGVNGTQVAVGRAGTGSLTIQDGGAVAINGGTIVQPVLQIGGTSGAGGGTGAVTVAGAGSQLVFSGTQPVINVGRNAGTASLTVENGGTVSGATVLTLARASSTATVTITGAGSSIALTGVGPASGAPAVFVGRSGSGTLNVLDGGALSLTAPAETSFAHLVIGLAFAGDVNGKGMVNVAGGGRIDIVGPQSQMLVGINGRPGTLNIDSGGQVTVGSPGPLFSSVVVGTGTGSDGAVHLTGAGSLLSAGSGIVVGGPSPGVHGTGLLDLGAGTAVKAADVVVLPGGTVAGDGVISADLQLNGGTLSPGHSPGTLGVHGTLQSSAASEIRLDIGGTLGHLALDHILVEIPSDLMLAGKLVFHLLDGLTPDVFGQLSIGDFFETFDGAKIDDASLFAGLELIGEEADSTTFIVPLEADGRLAVPEPGTLGPMIVGIAGALWMRRQSGRGVEARGWCIAR